MSQDPNSSYVFLPWLRQGVGGRIKETDRLGKSVKKVSSRASARASLFLRADGKEQISATQDVLMIGPGDITGIDKRAIVKTAPMDGYYNFQPNYLPHIQFYDEDFPWRYSPAAATGNYRLRPWLALIVLKEEEFERTYFKRSPLPAIKIFNWQSAVGPLPPASQSWAWAHVQTAPKYLGEGETPLRVISEEPNRCSSRIICPRKLLPNVKYYAFLVPAFEQGRLAGLGADPKEHILATDVQLHSWEKGIEHQFRGDHWPVYHEWHFKTGTRGDFEYLARLIKPHQLDATVGTQLIDIQSPGHRLSYLENNGMVAMTGALQTAGETVTSFPVSTSGGDGVSTGESEFLEALETLLNQNAGSAPDQETDKEYDDPFVLPPLYAQWHAGKDQVTRQEMLDPTATAHWHDSLNLDPRHRAAAGLGAYMVQEDQERLMDRIWDTFREWWVSHQEANQYQFSQQMGTALYRRHVSAMEDAQVMNFTAGIHSQIRVQQQNQTIHRQFSERSFSRSAFRRLTRSSGAVAKRTRPNMQQHIRSTALVQKVLSGSFVKATDYADPGRLATPAGVVSDNDLTANIRTLMQRYGIAENQLRTFLVSFEDVQGNVHYVNFEGNVLSEIDQTIVVSPGWGKILNPGGIVLSRAYAARSANNIAKTVRAGLEPTRSHAQRMDQMLGAAVGMYLDENGSVKPKPLNLEFREPMYRVLADYARQDFIPHLDRIPPNTFSLMQTNQAFVEAYMAGINHEFNRELLWREFPAAIGQTYFRRFWGNSSGNLAEAGAEEEYVSIKKIHLWDKPLGENRPVADQQEDLVFVIRGELLRAYPNPLIYMQQAIVQPQKRHRRFVGKTIKAPIFEARVEPDIYFFGFDITLAEAIGNVANPQGGAGWYLVVEERPGELNFGLDLEDEPRSSTSQNEAAGDHSTIQETQKNGWANLSWTDIGITSDFDGCIDLDKHKPEVIRQPPESEDMDPDEPVIYWGKGDEENRKAAAAGKGHAADMAAILYQPAYRINIHTSMLVKTQTKNG